jgi:hypothetical protein
VVERNKEPWRPVAKVKQMANCQRLLVASIETVAAAAMIIDAK